jgi:hypothetical protein
MSGGRERVSDRIIGIALGILLGLVIVIGFVFLGSEDTIDAPSLSGEQQDAQSQPTPTQTAPLTPTNPGP